MSGLVEPTPTAESVGLRPGRAALAVGQVTHHRLRPVDHRFIYPMTQIWIDPDDPGALFDQHRLWSHRRPAPVRFRRRDHLDGSERPLGPRIRDQLRQHLGRPIDGPVRMLTQPRVWGWLFNPITVFLAWDTDADIDTDSDTDGPTAALLEVTNTPWKQRHHYAMALEPAPPDGQGTGGRHARFAKALHVSPFLDLDHAYALAVATKGATSVLDLSLDVTPLDETRASGPVLRTRLTSRLLAADDPATHRAMTAVLRPDRLPTHRVSAGIHRQAASLWRKGVPFVPHPDRRP